MRMLTVLCGKNSAPFRQCQRQKRDPVVISTNRAERWACRLRIKSCQEAVDWYPDSRFDDVCNQAVNHRSAGMRLEGEPDRDDGNHRAQVVWLLRSHRLMAGRALRSGGVDDRVKRASSTDRSAWFCSGPRLWLASRHWTSAGCWVKIATLTLCANGQAVTWC